MNNKSYDDDDEKYADIIDRLRKAAPPIPPMKQRTEQEAEKYIMEIIEKAEAQEASKKNNKAKVGIFAGVGAAGIAGLLALNLFTAPALSVINLGGMGTSNAAGVAGEMAGDAKLSMMPWVNYTYSAGSELSKEAGNGSVYQIANDGDAKSVLRNIVNLFDVDGEVIEEYTSDYDGNTSISINYGVKTTMGGGNSSEPYNPDEPTSDGRDSSEKVEEYVTADWTKPSVYVWQSSKEATATWSYNSGGDWSSENNTSEEVAKESATSLLSKLGYNANDFIIQASKNDWGTSVVASLKLEGEVTGLGFWFEYSGNNELRSASGQAFKIVKLGETELISAYDAADKRAGDWRYYGQPYYELSYGLGIAVSAKSSDIASNEVTEVEVSTDGSGTGEGSTTPIDVEGVIIDEPVDALPPVEEYTEPEEINVTLTKSKTVWLIVYDTNGVGFIVKGYELSSDTENTYPVYVIAVPDSLVNLPKQEDMLYTNKEG